MQKKRLGRTGLEVSVIGLGGSCLGLPTPQSVFDQYGTNLERKAHSNRTLGVAAVHGALEAGITLLDTAPLYFDSELILGEAIRQRPELFQNCILATKIGANLPGEPFDHSYTAAMQSIERSLKRLGVSHLPIVYIHDPMGLPIDVVMGKEGTFKTLCQLKAEKVIDFIGVAANDPETTAAFIATGEFDVATVSDAWSLINQKAAQKIFPEAERWNTGLIVTTAIERGLLATGYPLAGVNYHGRNFTPELIRHVGRIKALCDRFQIPILAAALQWAVRHPQVASAIPGARTAEEARMNADAVEIEIFQEFWEELLPLVQDFSFVCQ